MQLTRHTITTILIFYTIAAALGGLISVGILGPIGLALSVSAIVYGGCLVALAYNSEQDEKEIAKLAARLET